MQHSRPSSRDGLINEVRPKGDAVSPLIFPRHDFPKINYVCTERFWEIRTCLNYKVVALPDIKLFYMIIVHIVL